MARALDVSSVANFQRKVDLLEQPTCDIAVDELEVTGPFFKADGPAASNAIEVEVSPGVSVPFRSNGTDQMRTDFRLGTSPRVNEHPLDSDDPRKPRRRDLRAAGSQA